jgi:hypothetical protein
MLSDDGGIQRPGRWILYSHTFAALALLQSSRSILPRVPVLLHTKSLLLHVGAARQCLRLSKLHDRTNYVVPSPTIVRPTSPHQTQPSSTNQESMHIFPTKDLESINSAS